MPKRKRYQKRRKTRGRPNALLVGIPLLVAALGVLLWAALDYESAADGAATPAGQPLVAVHEMGLGPSIPFLPSYEPQPRLELAEASHDFGLIGPQDVVERTFTIRNTGDAPLTISRAYTTCGCATAEISTNVIPPGGAATARIVFDAGYHDSAGQTVRRGLILENNDPLHSQAEIWIQADVASS